MASKIFVNLPVRNLEKSVDFFTHLGFSFNPMFTDEQATCMIIADNIFAMLLVESRFKDFIKQPVSDANKTTEVLLAIDAPSREAVNEMYNKAIEKGARQANEPQDHGWMFVQSFHDLDGHIWEIAYMDESAIPADFNQQ